VGGQGNGRGGAGWMGVREVTLCLRSGAGLFLASIKTKTSDLDTGE
jgi:hypothetical protein